MPRFAPWMIVAIFCWPIAGAWSETGTEAVPELTDPSDDVQYSPLYAGPKDLGHVDVLAVWFDYNASKDTLSMKVKLAAMEPARMQGGGTEYMLTVQADVSVDGGPKGLIMWQVRRDWSEDDFQVHTCHQPGQQCIPFVSNLTVTMGRPGYVEIATPRPVVQNIADAIEGQVLVQAWDFQATPAGSISNADDGQARASYDFSGLGPNYSNGTPIEPSPGGGPSDPEAGQGGRAMAVGALGTAMAVTIGLQRFRSASNGRP